MAEFPYKLDVGKKSPPTASGVGDFINMNMFDLSGYNMYPYNPATISHSLGYQSHIDYLKKAAPNKPLVVTEFGLSVSPDGPGNYGYGGNTLQEQMDGDLKTYRALIDGDAQGGCVFNYLDGWWKNFETENDADTHEPEPEEWFGLFGIDDESSDPNGTARPVWYAMKEYNMGIVTSPKNGEIYSSQVPLEVFCDQRVDSIRITMGPNTLYAENTGGNTYISDTLSLDIAQTKKDANLLFEFFDANNVTLKTENIIFLYAQSEPILPTLELNLSLANLNDGSVCPIEITAENQSDFAIKDNTVDYVFYPHLDWQPGEARSHVLNLVENTEQFADSYTVPSQTVILTVSAGFTIQYGEFEKRIYALETIQKGSWANPICHRSTRY